jgi:glutathione peroxidase
MRNTYPSESAERTVTDLLDLPVTTLQGEHTTLGALTAGRAALLVNVASRCGLTPQYAKLEALHESLAGAGFTVLGFPCNQFGGQEPGTADEIAEFCSDSYGVTFPMTDKIEVNGPDRDPIFATLTAAADSAGHDGDVRWNFEKFLVTADGRVAARFDPRTEPDAPEIRDAIEAVLG